ncbi:MAG: metallophosphoesterase [Bacteroidetes bacterium]|nr:metallophosphoesterase [Bacteroidota bacterium]
MRIQYCSDLHLEFLENKDFLISDPLKPGGDILLLAGDIVPFAVMGKHDDFFDYISANFEKTFWIPGNHEYYRSDINLRSGTFLEPIRDNVFLLNNSSIIIDGIKFIFSTMWSKISPDNYFHIRKGMSDFHVIKRNHDAFIPADFNQLHSECFSFLEKEIREPFEGKKMVVTHHVPTLLNYPKKYKGDILNEAFALELYDFIEQTEVDYWLFGHHHYNPPSFTIGKTLMITNQLGYVKYDENETFNNEMEIIL